MRGNKIVDSPQPRTLVLCSHKFVLFPVGDITAGIAPGFSYLL